MTLTPSSTSSAISGAAFSTIMWSILSHLDSIPVFGKLLPKEAVFEWVNSNRTLSLILTETTNFAVHGVTNPNSVMMALGASIVNSLAIFGWIPMRQKRLRRKMTGRILTSM